jgi:two-component system sensor histidine kinase KdpD
LTEPRLGNLDRQTVGAAQPLLSVLAVLIVGSLFISFLQDLLGSSTLLGAVYLPGIVLIAIRYGFLWSLAAIIVTVAAFDYFYVEPANHFTKETGKYIELVAVSVSTAAISFIASQAYERAVLSARRLEETSLLAELATDLLPLADLEGAPELAGARELVVERLGAALGCSVRIADDAAPGAVRLRSGERTMATLAVSGASAPEAALTIERLAPAIGAMLSAVERRVELEREARHAEALRRSDATKTAILRAVSHDFRSPLTALSTAIEMIGDDGLEQAARAEMLDVAAATTADLRSLVDNVLDLARLEAGAASPRSQWVSVEDVLARALAAEPGLEVRLELDQLPLVWADPVHLERVFVNLLGNARQHAAGLGIGVSAAVAVGGMLSIVVSDQGPGVDQALGDAAFEPFRSGEPGSGTGLGLAIVRGFVEANGGRVTIAAAESGGAAFTVELPVEDREHSMAPEPPGMAAP